MVIKIVAEGNICSLAGSDWRLKIQKLACGPNHDQTLILVKPVKARFITASQTFVYDDLASPVWLTETEFDYLVQLLTELKNLKIV